MIKKLKVERFKGVELFEQELGGLNVLVGTNNSGKSSILQAVHFAVSVCQSRKIYELGTTMSSQQLLYTPVQDVMTLAYGVLSLRQQKKNAIEVSMELADGDSGIVNVSRGKNANLNITMSGTLIPRLEEIGSPFSIYVPGLAGIAKSESFVARGQLVRSIARGDSNLVLRNVLYLLNQAPSKWTSFLNSLHAIFVDSEIEIKFAPVTDDAIAVIVRLGGQASPLEAAGTGFLQAVQILSYVHLFEPVITLLDEPDSHLHPFNQRLLSRLLIRLAEESKTQVLLATHSRHILDELGDDAKILWLRNGKVEAPRTQGFSLDILGELGALDQSEGLINRGVKFVILTEDKSHKQLRLLLQSCGVVDGDYVIFSYQGCTNQAVAKGIATVIKEISKTSKIILHRDSDFLDTKDKDHLRDCYHKLGIEVFFTVGTDIESHFLSLDHLKTLNPGNESVLQDVFSETLVSLKEELRRRAHEGAKVVDAQRYKEGRPSIGKEAQEAWASNIDLESGDYLQGKPILSKMRELFKDRTKVEMKVYQESTYILKGELPVLTPDTPKIQKRPGELF
jgi:energy-coupling factor transporter ATP-binding protein EcfA2